MLRSIHPAELVYILGKNLELDHANEEEGIFFIGSKGKETRIASYGRGNAGQLAFVVPSLAAGVCTIQVRALRDEEGLQVGSGE